jgi:PBP1b-binding outer membrane lipoprotein LpoB
MRKAVKIFSVLSVLLLAMLFITGCPNGPAEEEDEEYKNPTALTTEWQTFYIKSVDADRTDAPNLTGLERWHFHNNTNDGSSIGMEIQKVFVASTKSEGVPSGASIIVDFTLGSASTDYNVNVYDTTFAVGTTTDGKWSTGVQTVSEYQYLGNIGTGAGADAVYWGFVMRNISDTARADTINVESVGSNLDSGSAKILSLATWFGIAE